MSHASTIYALASAPGKSGVAVFRISGSAGPSALRFLGVEKPLTPRMATLVKLSHAGEPLDEALALFFPAPHSFTGEDVVELHTHGSRAVTKMLLEALSQVPGLRLAEPGEFARRAFMNGKLDLAQAEGLGDLIDAETKTQQAQAIRQIRGDLSKRISELRNRVLIPLALLEAYIDFPDEEIPESVLLDVSEQIQSLVLELKTLLDDGNIGEKIREGLEVVIFGPPNAGKSSLLNALAKREAAIVSSEAGTTRDVIEIQMEIGGYAVTLADTAGLRETSGEIEAEGIRRAQARTAQADIKICLCDADHFDEHFAEMVPLIDENTLLLVNKTDLKTPTEIPSNALHISVKSGSGMNDFLDQLKQRIAVKMDHVGTPIITRARHRESWKLALTSLERFSTDAPLELMCEELRIAATAIGKITGKIAVDDLLDVIFSTFCIGK